jgi:hypothetical protein
MLLVGGEISRHDGVARKGTEHEVGARGPGRGTWDLECGAKYEGEVDGRERVERIVKRMVHRGECPIDRVEGRRRGGKGV